MKNFFKSHVFLLISAMLLFTGAAQADPVFHFEVGADNRLLIHPADNPTGAPIATLSPGDIGKEISAPPYVYQVSYGHDADGRLSIIVAPAPSNPTNLTFSIQGHTVDLDRTSAVTVTLGVNGGISIDPGTIGAVRVDGRTATTVVGNAGTGGGNAGTGGGTRTGGLPTGGAMTGGGQTTVINTGGDTGNIGGDNEASESNTPQLPQFSSLTSNPLPSVNPTFNPLANPDVTEPGAPPLTPNGGSKTGI